MTRFSRTLLAHRRAAVALALLALALGLLAAPFTVPRLTSDFPHEGSPAYETNAAITGLHGNGGEQRPFVPVVLLPEGTRATDPEALEAVAAAFDAVAARGSRVTSYADTRDPALLGGDGRTVLGLVYPAPAADGSPPGGGLGEVPDASPGIEAAMLPHLPEGTRVEVTGLDALAPGQDAGGLNVPLKVGVTAVAAVVVLGLVFRSALAVVPLVTAGVAVAAAFPLLFALSLVTDVHTQAMTLLPLLGLGLALDYALLVITRWREERARGCAGEEAVHRAMGTAGRSVLFSATAVGVGMATMLVLPVGFLRSLGAAGLIIAATGAAVSLTLLPVLLAAVGERVDRRGAARGDGTRAERAWGRWAGWVVRRRWAVLLGTGAVLVALSAVGLRIDMSVPASTALDRSGPGGPGLELLEGAGTGTGVLTPVEVLVPAGDDAAATAAELAAVPGVRTVLEPPGWRADGASVLAVLPEHEGGTPEGEALIAALTEVTPHVGGYAAQNADLVAATYGAFPLVLALVAVVTFVMLARAFRSLLLPLKAVVLNLLSLGAVLGALVLLWQWGVGTEWLLGLAPTGVVGQFVPVTVFAFLYGLSTDYEVFVLARMRESYDRTGSTDTAVVEGVARTGRLVTGAALILFAAFASMASGGEFDVAVFATGMALGVLVDATLVRGLLLPASVAVLGRWNWWLPAPVARLLRVAPAPLPRRSAGHPVGVG